MMNHQFVHVAGISPRLQVGNPQKNVEYMISAIERIKGTNPSIIAFPELAITGYTAHDLFFQSDLIKETMQAIHYFLNENPSDRVIIFGAPIPYLGQLFNTAVVVHRHQVLGIVPKIYLPNYDEFYEKRVFASGSLLGDETVWIEMLDAPMGRLLFYEESQDLTFGIEICEDLYAPITPSSFLSINGAELIVNLSSSSAIVGKETVRRSLVEGTSRRNHTAYLYVSSGRHESTQDIVFTSHNMLVENGRLLFESQPFAEDAEVLLGAFDLGRVKYERRKSSTLKDSLQWFKRPIQKIRVDLKIKNLDQEIIYPLNRQPFVPQTRKKETFEYIRQIQVNSLAKRLDVTRAKKLFLGLSGGLDSTLALLIACDSFRLLKKDPKDLIAVTLPGYGTSARTKDNARALAEQLGVSFQTISIKESVDVHFQAIGHDPRIKDVTYENAQARERTQVLLDLANKFDGLMLGTGDLSELALGWTTFNGDHMANYNVNVGLPKTLVQFMVKSYADFVYHEQPILRDTLYDILATPISPELTGSDQQTEEILGKYEVHDFILYRLLVCGDDKERIRYLLAVVFPELRKTEIDSYIETFYRRFFSQQFKRSTLPDGPKIVEVSLSPRAGFRMASDVEIDG